LRWLIFRKVPHQFTNQQTKNIWNHREVRFQTSFGKREKKTPNNGELYITLKKQRSDKMKKNNHQSVSIFAKSLIFFFVEPKRKLICF
jgi:hypothetical protein